jgi:hypothetical protein
VFYYYISNRGDLGENWKKRSAFEITVEKVLGEVEGPDNELGLWRLPLQGYQIEMGLSG